MKSGVETKKLHTGFRLTPIILQSKLLFVLFQILLLFKSPLKLNKTKGILLLSYIVRVYRNSNLSRSPRSPFY